MFLVEERRQFRDGPCSGRVLAACARVARLVLTTMYCSPYVPQPELSVMGGAVRCPLCKAVCPA